MKLEAYEKCVCVCVFSLLRAHRPAAPTARQSERERQGDRGSHMKGRLRPLSFLQPSKIIFT